jgi:hypothetical protein
VICRLGGTLNHISATRFKTRTPKGLADGEEKQLNEMKQKGECIDYWSPFFGNFCALFVVKVTVFWDASPHSLVEICRRFDGMCPLHLQNTFYVATDLRYEFLINFLCCNFIVKMEASGLIRNHFVFLPVVMASEAVVIAARNSNLIGLDGLTCICVELLVLLKIRNCIVQSEKFILSLFKYLPYRKKL